MQPATENIQLTRSYKAWNGSSTSPDNRLTEVTMAKHACSVKSSSTTSTMTSLDTMVQRECILFPTYATQNPHDASEWIVQTEGWALSHSQTNGPKDKIFMGLTKSFARQSSVDFMTNRMYHQRFKYFLAKNKHNKQMVIQAVGTTFAEQCFAQRSKQDVIWMGGEDDAATESDAPIVNHLKTQHPCTAGLSHSFVGTAQTLSTTYSVFDNTNISINDNNDDDDSEELSSMMAHSLATRPGNPAPVVLDRSPSMSSAMSLPSLSSAGPDSTSDMSTMEQSSNVLHVRTDSNGRFHGKFTIPHAPVIEWAKAQQQSDTRLIRLHIQSHTFAPSFGIVNLIEPTGISIISDIDDTIKDTQILAGPRTVIANTFFKTAKAVDGMAEIYMRWYTQGASFHYVSNSPFQLMPMLAEFLKKHQFPPGSMHLRVDGSLLARVFETPGRSKRDTIRQMLHDFPNRKFILIGDSGEIDLEIYARIASEHPGQILKIMIRDISPEKPQRRYTFSSVFRQPSNSSVKQQTNTSIRVAPPTHHDTQPTRLQSRIAKAQKLTQTKIITFRKAEAIHSVMDVTDALQMALDDRQDTDKIHKAPCPPI